MKLVNKKKHLKDLNEGSVSKRSKILSKIVARKGVSDRVIEKRWGTKE